MKTHLLKTWFALAGVACMLLVSGCANTPYVRVASDPYANFSQYQSFAFISPLGTDRSSSRPPRNASWRHAVCSWWPARRNCW